MGEKRYARNHHAQQCFFACACRVICWCLSVRLQPPAAAPADASAVRNLASSRGRDFAASGGPAHHQHSPRGKLRRRRQNHSRLLSVTGIWLFGGWWRAHNRCLRTKPRFADARQSCTDQPPMRVAAGVDTNKRLAGQYRAYRIVPAIAGCAHRQAVTRSARHHRRWGGSGRRTGTLTELGGATRLALARLRAWTLGSRL